MKKILSAAIVFCVMIFSANCFASDLEYIGSDTDNNKYYIDKQSISRLKWDKDKDDFQFSVIVGKVFDEYSANNRYSDSYFSYKGIYISDPVAYSLDKVLFRRHKGKRFYKSSGEVDFNSSGQRLWVWKHHSSWHEIKENSMYRVIYDAAYEKL